MFTFAQRFFVFINLFISGMWRIIWYCTVWDRVFTRYPCSDIYRCLFATGHRPADIEMSPKTVHVVAALPVLCTPLQTVMQVIPRCHGGVCVHPETCACCTQPSVRRVNRRREHHILTAQTVHRSTVTPCHRSSQSRIHTNSLSCKRHPIRCFTHKTPNATVVVVFHVYFMLLCELLRTCSRIHITLHSQQEGQCTDEKKKQ